MDYTIKTNLRIKTPVVVLDNVEKYDEFVNDMYKLYSMGCPMTCDVKSIFDAYADYGEFFGFPVCALQTAKHILLKYTNIHSNQLYIAVITNNHKEFAKLWKFLKEKYNIL